MIVSPAPRRTVLSSRQVFPRKSAPAIGRTRPGKTDAEHANLLLDVTQACRSYEILLVLGRLSSGGTNGSAWAERIGVGVSACRRGQSASTYRSRVPSRVTRRAPALAEDNRGAGARRTCCDLTIEVLLRRHAPTPIRRYALFWPLRFPWERTMV